MFISLEIALITLCVMALVLVGLKYVIPVILHYIVGIGVEAPLPRKFAKAYPKLAVYLFVVASPLLFAALLATGIWLLRQL